MEAIIICLITYEYLSYKTLATPVVLLGGVYCFLVPLINIIGKDFGFYSINNFTIFMFTLFICIMFMPGFVIRKLFNKLSACSISDKLINKTNILLTIYTVSLVSYIINLIQVIIIYGVNDTKSHAFGIFAHIGMISRCLFPIIFWFYINTKNKLYLILMLLHLFSFVVFQGKYHIFMAVGGCIAIYLINNNVSIFKAIKVSIVSFVLGLFIFCSVYTIVPNILKGSFYTDTMINGLSFSVKHFFHYLFCPIIVSNEFFVMPAYNGLYNGLLIVFNPFQRLYTLIIQEFNYHSPVLDLWPMVDKYGASANVGGLFSETVLNIGYILSICYVFIISCIVYYFLFTTLFKKKMIVTSCYLLGMTIICFFL